jgi:hypothetical protein
MKNEFHPSALILHPSALKEMSMPVLANYNQFNGRHWETGSVANFLAYHGANGAKAPHTGRPYSEALLMGVSGGVVMAYFSFAYEGYDPMVRILTRNTFDPWNTMLSRLGVVQNVEHSTSAEKGKARLIRTLEEGLPAIVWADMWSLPYNALAYDASMWGMMPLVVYGYDETADRAYIADRAAVPLRTTTAELDAARARVKKDKYRLVTLEPPQPEKLASAVQLGIWDCIKLYTEAPPKGTKKNFGLEAFRWWAELLTRPMARMSWAREFPAGRKMLAGLISVYESIAVFGQERHGRAERDTYADFLDEAAVILERPGLREAAARFRASAEAWDALALAVLPDEVALLSATRELILRRHQLFIDQGNGALEEMRAIDGRLREIKEEVAADFPLDGAGVETLRESVAGLVMGICEIEEAAVSVLREAMV